MATPAAARDAAVRAWMASVLGDEALASRETPIADGVALLRLANALVEQMAPAKERAEPNSAWRHGGCALRSRRKRRPMRCARGA